MRTPYVILVLNNQSSTVIAGVNFFFTGFQILVKIDKVIVYIFTSSRFI